jgi:N-carbamoyl-L-amino-acid hydrolase
VGELQNYPNSRNVIPGRVRFTIDMRSWDDDAMEKGLEKLTDDFEEIARKRGCSVRMERFWEVTHSMFDPELVQGVLRSSEAFGYSTHSMVSGALHDAAYLSAFAPTAMIFVPSVGGRSHVADEATSWEDCEAGANVLLHSILQSARVVEAYGKN